MKRNIEDIYPLSPMQQGMLFHTLYAPDAQIYLTQMGCMLEGALHVSAFEQAWQQVVDRHPILRTGFVWERRSEPLQIVFRDVQLAWVHLDWRDVAQENRQARLDAFMQANQARGFDLSRPPLIRPTLIRLEEQKSYLVLCHHHLLMDGWSLPLILSDVFTCYAATCRGEAPRLPARRPYADYIAWLGTQDLQQAESFWRRSLHGFTAPTSLGLDTPQAMDDVESYHDLGVTLPSELVAGLQALARQHKLTFSILIQAAWALLLHHYSGERDLLFGFATSGRQAPLEQIEAMIGLFVNTLPHRVQIRPELPLIDWFHELQSQQATLLDYEYSPLVRVQGWSQVPRGTALFQSLLIFDNYPVSEAVQEQAGDLHISFVQSIEHTNYPLTIRTRPGTETYLGISYATTAFPTEAVERMVQHLLTVLRAFVANPAQQLKDVNILSESERQQLLLDWNATETPYPAEQPLNRLFEAQVRRTPDALAAVCGEQRLTYRQLNTRANQLARALRQRGIRTGDLVGIHLERSLEMLVAVLAVLKTAAAYVPLDPSYPAERLTFLCEDAHLALLLTQPPLTDRLVSSSPLQRLCLDGDGTTLEARDASGEDLALEINGQQMAYVLYTSGSTGQPKGVQIPHSALVNFLQAMQKRLQLTTRDTLLAVTSLSFDIAGLELFLPILTGACVVIASQDETSDGQRLAEVLMSSAATIMQATPATWRLLIAAGWSGTAGLKILCGGEALPADLARELCARADFVVNLYGPTETTIWSTSAQLDAEREMETITIGRPLDNTQIYLLNEHLQPVPRGIRGDLYIGGAGLASGYLLRPALTAERFIPHPFALTPGARLYKTGDIARYRADGAIEFLGRSDHQVKVRGYRIELGEIESALAGHVQVTQSIVFLREESGEKHLVAYIKAAETTPPSVGELRDYLKKMLPPYMLPSHYVFLQDFPLTPNGKINYHALPAPDNQRPTLLEEFVSARTPEEQVLTHIWQELLGLEQVGIHDNFFDLGGHSLMMMQMYTRVQGQFPRNLQLVDMFKYPTIAALAEYLTTEEQEDRQMQTTLEQADERANLRTQLRQRQQRLRQKQHLNL